MLYSRTSNQEVSIKSPPHILFITLLNFWFPYSIKYNTTPHHLSLIPTLTLILHPKLHSLFLYLPALLFSPSQSPRKMGSRPERHPPIQSRPHIHPSKRLRSNGTMGLQRGLRFSLWSRIRISVHQWRPRPTNGSSLWTTSKAEHQPGRLGRWLTRGVRGGTSSVSRFLFH